MKKYDKDMYEKPSVAVDLLVFTIEENKLKLLMVERSEEPFKGYYALPGVFVRMNETLDEAARRGLEEEAGLSEIYMEQLYTWGDIQRDPRMRIISVSYIALVAKSKVNPVVGQRVLDVGLYTVDEIQKGSMKLAFDHDKIISYGLERIRNKIEYQPIAFELVGEQFTLPELQKIYEIILGKPLYKANFRKRIMEFVEETGEMTGGENHRPSKLHRRKS